MIFIFKFSDKKYYFCLFKLISKKQQSKYLNLLEKIYIYFWWLPPLKFLFTKIASAPVAVCIFPLFLFVWKWTFCSKEKARSGYEFGHSSSKVRNLKKRNNFLIPDKNIEPGIPINTTKHFFLANIYFISSFCYLAVTFHNIISLS